MNRLQLSSSADSPLPVISLSGVTSLNALVTYQFRSGLVIYGTDSTVNHLPMLSLHDALVVTAPLATKGVVRLAMLLHAEGMLSPCITSFWLSLTSTVVVGALVVIVTNGTFVATTFISAHYDLFRRFALVFYLTDHYMTPISSVSKEIAAWRASNSMSNNNDNLDGYGSQRAVAHHLATFYPTYRLIAHELQSIYEAGRAARHYHHNNNIASNNNNSDDNKNNNNNEWICTLCTLRNPSMHIICSMCASPNRPPLSPVTPLTHFPHTPLLSSSLSSSSSVLSSPPSSSASTSMPSLPSSSVAPSEAFLLSLLSTPFPNVIASSSLSSSTNASSPSVSSSVTNTTLITVDVVRSYMSATAERCQRILTASATSLATVQ
jgi:hypothetical protein